MTLYNTRYGMEAEDMMREGCGMKIMGEKYVSELRMMDEKYVFLESQDGWELWVRSNLRGVLGWMQIMDEKQVRELG